MENRKSIAIVGTGKVAFNLLKGFEASGNTVDAIYGRKESIDWGEASENRAYHSIDSISTNHHVYIIAVSDDAISKVVGLIPPTEGIVCHTSGSVGITVLSKFKHTGVFYPLQTFTTDRKVSMRSVPFLIEGSEIETEKTLITLAKKLSDQVAIINSEQRKTVHLAAVLVNNFTNLLYESAFELMRKNGLDSALLLPLIQETAEKISQIPPHMAQTGPAKRGDHEIINQHINLLNSNPGLQEIYKLVSLEIQKLHKTDG